MKYLDLAGLRQFYNKLKTKFALKTEIPTSLPANGGRADSADKLTTPRTINGVAFDGTANITIEAGAVDSVFGRTGAVVAQESDYKASYPVLEEVTDLTFTPPSLVDNMRKSIYDANGDGKIDGAVYAAPMADKIGSILINADTLQNKTASEFATATQGTKADDAYALQGGTEILTNADLNTYKTVGNYYYDDPTQFNISNAPFNTMFTLKVFKATGVRYISQRIRKVDTPYHTFERMLQDNDSWTAWALVSSDLSSYSKLVKLWENASPTSAFGAQTISLDFSKYNIFVIVSKINTTNDEYQVAMATKNILSLASISSSGEFAYYTRKFTFTDNQVTISNNTSRTPSYVGEQNQQNIPYKIYGIKGVQ